MRLIGCLDGSARLNYLGPFKMTPEYFYQFFMRQSSPHPYLISLEKGRNQTQDFILVSYPLKVLWG